MKMNYWVLFAALISTSLLAQPALTNAPAAAPAGAPEAVAPTASAASKTNAPAAKKKSVKKPAKKTAARKKDPAAQLRTVPLTAGTATVIASNVNVRGQAKLNSEVVTRLTKGQSVSVLEEVTLKKSGPDEPSAWAKIILPPQSHVWVHSSFVDVANKTVLPKKLKVRGGPGENYSVLGILKHGDEVKQTSSKGDWLEIEAPAEACAFVAAQYLRQEAPGAIVAAVTETPPATTTLTEPPPVAPTTTEAPAPNPAPDAGGTNTVAPNGTENTPPAAEEPPPKRIVLREGLVRGTFSIQAPTRFELISINNGKAINYLYTTSPDLDLGRYKGLHIIVTGEEGLDERWRNTPIITIQKIDVVE
jgi:uncharacterized protein YraI